MKIELTIKNRTWTFDSLKQELEVNDELMYRMLIKMYDKQEQIEKDTVSTQFANDKGFNKADGRYLAVAARYYLKHKKHNPNPMDRQYRENVRTRLLKYTGQIWNDLVEEYTPKPLAF
jgi:DNA invertase Pin-like site-specific DNA recombinase